MNFQTPSFPSMDNIQPTQQVPVYPSSQFQQVPFYGQQFPQFPQQQPPVSMPGAVSPFVEQSYVENILRLNIGKVATVYMNFENSQWGSRVFKGIIRGAGRDHIVLIDQDTGTRYLLLTIYLNYITFDEPINYDYPFNGISTFGQQTPPPIQPQTATPFTQLRKKDNKE